MISSFALLALWFAGALVSSPAAPPPLAQEALSQAASRFSQAWVGRDLGTIGTLLAAEGVRITIEGQDYHVLAERQALVTLGDFLSRHEGDAFDVKRIAELGGDPAHGISEVIWEAVDKSSGERLDRTLFVAFILEAGAWRVEELRILR